VESTIGALALHHTKGRTVMQLGKIVGAVGGPTAELWPPVLVEMHGNTFRLSGIEKASGGAWVHKAWHCEVGGAWRHDEFRATQRDLTKPATCNLP
jgi:hypothetical protein